MVTLTNPVICELVQCILMINKLVKKMNAGYHLQNFFKNTQQYKIYPRQIAVHLQSRRLIDNSTDCAHRAIFVRAAIWASQRQEIQMSQPIRPSSPIADLTSAEIWWYASSALDINLPRLAPVIKCPGV